MRVPLPTRSRRGRRRPGDAPRRSPARRPRPRSVAPYVGGARRSRTPGSSRDRRRSSNQRRLRPSVLNRRVVLLGLVLASLGLLTASARDRVGTERVQMAALAVIAPVERGIDRAWQPFGDAAGWVSALLRATDENPKLIEENRELRLRLHGSAQQADELRRLTRIAALQERGTFPDGFRMVTGSVVARPAAAVDGALIIDLGTDHGVQVDDPVMSVDGLLGRVLSVTSNSARVGLLIDNRQAVSAVVVDSQGTGVLRPVSNEGTPVLDLAYVSPRARVRRGELVVTSGWSTGNLQSIYPKGIPVGLVSSVTNDPADLYKKVQVTPFADFDRIDYVHVLVPTDGAAARMSLEEPPPAATGASSAGRGSSPTGTPAPRRSRPAPGEGTP